MQIAVPNIKVSNSVGLRYVPRICISTGDDDVARPGTSLFKAFYTLKITALKNCFRSEII